MDAHTLELLEYEQVCALVAGYAACALGKRLALAMSPGTDPAAVMTDLHMRVLPPASELSVSPGLDEVRELSGHGGQVALKTAIDFPERVQHVVMIGSAPDTISDAEAEPPLISTTSGNPSRISLPLASQRWLSSG